MHTQQTTARKVVPLGSARTKTRASGGISQIEAVTLFHYN